MADDEAWLSEEAAAHSLGVPRWALAFWPRDIGFEVRQNAETGAIEYERGSLERVLARYGGAALDRQQASARLRNAANLRIIAEAAIGADWMPIVLRLYGDLLQTDPGVGLQQVKEKFGGLRVYYEPSTCEEKALVRLAASTRTAEQTAARTCEICGSWQDVSTWTSSPDIHWIRTLCEKHHRERRRQSPMSDGQRKPIINAHLEEMRERLLGFEAEPDLPERLRRPMIASLRANIAIFERELARIERQERYQGNFDLESIDETIEEGRKLWQELREIEDEGDQ